MVKEYIKDIIRMNFNLFDVKAWYFGEKDELKKWLDFGFENTIFVIENKNVTVYYDQEEIDKFYNVLDNKLNEDFFNQICNYYFSVLICSPKNRKEASNLSIKLWPALAIFHEISNYPEYATEGMLRRLQRIRKFTEGFPYKIMENFYSENLLTNYIFFKGKIYKKPLNIFIKENDFKIIENEQ